MDLEQKTHNANEILKALKEEVLQLITESETKEYCGNRSILPWLEEDTEYALKKLELPKELEKKYLRKVIRILGEYTEDTPFLKRKKEAKK
jgi:hypothetical protein